MRAVRAYRELELKQELVGRQRLRISDTTILPPDLAEFARPVGQRQCLPDVAQARVVAAIGPVETDACKPAAPKLIVAGRVVPDAPLRTAKLVAAAPDHLGAAKERAVDGALQRAPAHCSVDAPQIGHKPSDIYVIDEAGVVVTPRVRSAQVNIRILR